MRLLPNLSKFARLSPHERPLLLTSVVLLPVMAAALRVAGFARIHRWLANPFVQRRTRRDAEPHALAALVNAASNNLPIRCSCLTRSLLLDWMLRRRGVDSELRFGVRLIDGRLQAHAWVEFNGAPLNDSADVAERFAPFDGRVPPRLRAAP